MHDLRRLFKRIALLGAPLLVLLAAYALLDPFRVLYPHDALYGPKQYVPVNRDFASTELYLRHPNRRKLDSFIFGSSRSIAFRASDWRRLTGSAHVYHFDAAWETLFGVTTKVRFLQNDGRRIAHALLVLDGNLLASTTDAEEYVWRRKDPRIAGTNPLGFHARFLRTYMNPFFFTRYLRLVTFGAAPTETDTTFQIGRRELGLIPETNELLFVGLDREIAERGESFFADLAARHPRGAAPPRPAPPVIGPEQMRMLEELRERFLHDGTNVRIVIPPLYDQVPMNPADVAVLRSLFGTHVHDFSGVNRFTENVQNYYEPLHFRPHVATAIMETIYGGRRTGVPLVSREPAAARTKAIATR